MPPGSPPPTYDYNAALPGVQGPTSLLAGHTSRTMRTHAVAFQTLVPLAELQAALPAGFMAVANPAGSTTAQVTLAFVYQQRTEIVGQGTFGPASSLFVTTTATNSALSRQELLQLAVYASDQALVDAVNAHFGPGSFRLAEVELEFEQKKSGRLDFDGTVEHNATNFRVKASAECPGPIDTRVTNDPGPLPVRFVGGGSPVNPSFRAASQLDNRIVPVATAEAKIEPTHGPLRLPGGNVTITSVGPSVIFARWAEIFSKPE